MSDIVGSLLFSGIGFVAFMYGKRSGYYKLMGLGGLLMVYSYFTPTLFTYLIGGALTALLYFRRDWFCD